MYNKFIFYQHYNRFITHYSFLFINAVEKKGVETNNNSTNYNKIEITTSNLISRIIRHLGNEVNERHD